MSKGILEYNLDDNDDKMAMNRALKSLDMACVLFEIQFNLRKKIERILEAEEANEEEFRVIDKVFNHINREFEEYGINLDELIE